MNKLWLLAATTLATAALSISCGGEDSADDAPAQTLQLAMQDIAYDSQALTATRGATVRLDLENRGAIAHDFTIERIDVDNVEMTGGMTSGEHGQDEDGPDLHIALDAGATGSLEFSPSEAGTFEYFCTVAGHREAGMRGTLTVE